MADCFYTLAPNTYVLIALGLLALLIVGTFVIWVLELQPGSNSPLNTFDASFTYMLQNVSGVWIGSQPPSTGGGRAFAVVVILIAAAIHALLIAALVSGFVNRVLIQGQGKGRVRMDHHVLICGWNSRCKQVIDVLEREAFGAGVPIVLLAQVSHNPYPDSTIKFISGNATHMEDLERAGVKTARAAIAVTDESDSDPHMDSTYDARAVLTVLALKEANPGLHVVAQLRDRRTASILNAPANEIIASAEMSEGLLARSALNMGIAQTFSQPFASRHTARGVYRRRLADAGRQDLSGGVGA